MGRGSRHQHVVGESGGERAQGGVEVDGEIGVGARRPALVRGAAGGERRPADRERVQRIGRLAERSATKSMIARSHAS